MPSPAEFREQLLAAMDSERGRVTATLEATRTFEVTQVAAVWFSENRVEDPRRICAVLYGRDGDEIGFVRDLDPAGPVLQVSGLSRHVPPMSLRLAATNILTYLFGSD